MFPIFTIVLGRTNTGKTTFTREELVERYRKSRDRVLVVTPHFNEWSDCETINISKKGFYKFTGIKRTIVNEETIPLLNDRFNYYRNGLIIFDDLRFFIGNSIKKDLEQLFISLDQRKIDIIGAAHGFTRVPPIFFTYATDVVLFKTKDNIKKRKDVINEDDFDYLLEMQKRVNQHKDYHYKEIYNIIS